ncbi:MAG: hypothetical protein K0M78_13425, partial [Brevundimonas sp.]|nr:hypothetical protein [Brevundimonas sp.]
WDPADPQASEAALTALEVAAAHEGRASDFLTLRRMRRAAGLKPAAAPHRRPEAGFRIDWADPKATYASMLEAMMLASDEGRHGDFRTLDRLLKQVDVAFRDLETDRALAAR